MIRPSTPLRAGLLLIALLLITLPTFGMAADPGVYDITMQAGEDYRLTLKLTGGTGAPIDLTGTTYAAQFRSGPAPSGAAFATYSANMTMPATSGLISVRLSKAQTLALSGKTGLWDLRQIDSAGLAAYILTGKCYVRPTVTR